MKKRKVMIEELNKKIELDIWTKIFLFVLG